MKHVFLSRNSKAKFVVVKVLVLLAKASLGRLTLSTYFQPQETAATMSDSELACVYSALILHDAGIPITVSLCACVR